MKESKQKLKAMKKPRDLIKEAQAAFNAYIRNRAMARGDVCISSGKPLNFSGVGGGFDCGHYRSIGSAPHLRFNMLNAWGQSKHDNRYLSGNAVEYRKGLIARIGLEAVERLESDNRQKKYTVEYLDRIIRIFKKKSKRILKKTNW